MQDRLHALKSSDFANAFYFVAFLFIVIYSLYSLKTLLSSIAIAILIWFLINSFASALIKLPFMNNKVGRFLSIPISLVLIFLTLLQISAFIGSNIAELTASLSGLDTKVLGVIEKYSAMFGLDMTQSLKGIMEQLKITSIINRVLSLFSDLLGNSVQILLYVLFLLLDQRFFPMKLKALFPNEGNREHVNSILSSISENVKLYIMITTLVSFCTGVLTFIICQAFGLEGAGLWGFLAFILNFIPTIGSIIAVIVPTLFAMVQLGDITFALLLIPALGVVQFLLGNILQPRLMGNRLNISQFVVIFSLIAWGALWGTVGMFLSVPLMVILMIIFSQFESTRPLAILISGDGKIISMDNQK